MRYWVKLGAEIEGPWDASDVVRSTEVSLKTMVAPESSPTSWQRLKHAPLLSTAVFSDLCNLLDQRFRTFHQ